MKVYPYIAHPPGVGQSISVRRCLCTSMPCYSGRVDGHRTQGCNDVRLDTFIESFAPKSQIPRKYAGFNRKTQPLLWRFTPAVVAPSTIGQG